MILFAAISAAMIVLSVLWVFIVRGYRLYMTIEAPVYAELLNIPFNEMPVATKLKAGDVVELLHCVDFKSDVAFKVRTSNGIEGFLYSTYFYAVSVDAWSDRENWKEAFTHPFDSLTCLTLIPHLAKIHKAREKTEKTGDRQRL
jgi:hypothetical protein